MSDGRAIYINKVAQALGGEHLGQVKAGAGYFGALQTVATVAQLAGQRPFKPDYEGSSPSGGTKENE